jgi:hypothetical protein
MYSDEVIRFFSAALPITVGNDAGRRTRNVMGKRGDDRWRAPTGKLPEQLRVLIEGPERLSAHSCCGHANLGFAIGRPFRWAIHAAEIGLDQHRLISPVVNGPPVSSCELRSNESRLVREGEVAPSAPTPVSSALHETAVNGWLRPGPLALIPYEANQKRVSQITIARIARGSKWPAAEKFSGSATGKGSAVQAVQTIQRGCSTVE